MPLEITLFIGAFTSLFSIVNPINATPIFISLTEHDTNERRFVIARKASTNMFFVLLAFFIGGSYILSFFGLSLPGIRIAGGLMLGRSAFDMLNPKTKGEKLTKQDVEEAVDKPDVSFTPLAMPLLSGPGSIAAVIALAADSHTLISDISVIVAIFVLSIITYLILRVSPYAVKILGKTGLTVMTKIMGFIVLCVAVQFIINGVIPLLTEIFSA